MNIFTMLSSSRGSKKLTIGNVIKFSNYKSSVLHTELRVSTLVLFISVLFIFSQLFSLLVHSFWKDGASTFSQVHSTSLIF